MKRKLIITGGIMSLPTLKDLLENEDFLEGLLENIAEKKKTIYIHFTSLYVFVDGEIFLSPVTQFVEEKDLFDGFCVPLLITEESINILSDEVSLILVTKPVEEKETLCKGMYSFGKTTIYRPSKKEELLNRSSFMSIIDSFLRGLYDNTINDTEILEFSEALANKADITPLNTIMICKGLVTNAINALGTAPLNEFDMIYKENLENLLELLENIISTKSLHENLPLPQNSEELKSYTEIIQRRISIAVQNQNFEVAAKLQNELEKAKLGVFSQN